MPRSKKIHQNIGCFCLFVFLSAFFLIGCATPTALSLEKQNSHYVPKDPNKKGMLFFYWESGLFGYLRGIYIDANGKRIGGLNRGTYFCYEANPGEITIAAENWLQDDQTHIVIVEAGQKVYFRAGLDFTIVDAVPYIMRVDSVVGKAAIKKLQYATLK